MCAKLWILNQLKTCAFKVVLCLFNNTQCNWPTACFTELNYTQCNNILVDFNVCFVFLKITWNGIAKNTPVSLKFSDIWDYKRNPAHTHFLSVVSISEYQVLPIFNKIYVKTSFSSLSLPFFCTSFKPRFKQFQK